MNTAVPAREYSVGFKKPTLVFPASIRFELMRAIMPPRVGEDAEVPDTKTIVPPTTTA